MGALFRIVAVFLVLTGMTLFLAGEVSAAEVVFAVTCATAGTVLAFALSRVAKKHFAVSFPAAAFLRPLAALIPETILVGRELLAVALRGAPRQRGEFVHQPYDFGGDDPISTSRRALTVIGVSLAPRTFVVRGEPDAVLLHALPKKPPSPDRTWPT